MATHILLTGSSRGIGAATFDALTEAGARGIGHGTSSGIPADFTDPAAPRMLWEKALDALDGRIDVLVNNAGIFDAAPIDLVQDAWVGGGEGTRRVTLPAPAELCRLAIRHGQAEACPGRIVNMASRAAYRGDSPAHW